MLDALTDGVRVIWYEAPAQVSSIDLFTRLNSGRIPLDDAELFKALVLSQTLSATTGSAPDGEGTRQLRANELAVQWDMIERDLRRPEIWAFLAGNRTCATHISLLLEIVAGVAPDAHLEASVLRPFLTARSSVCWFDWRYYFVAYQSMRESAQGCYSPAKEDGAVRMGYVVRRHNNVEWAYRDTDPYLDAVCAKVDERMANRLTREQTELMVTGQWLRLDGIGITVASRQDGWRIFLPVEHPANIEVQSVFSAFGVQQCVNKNDADETDSSVFWHLPISQSDSVPEGIDPPGMREVSLVDREDRVQRAADFISALLHATMGVVTAASAEGEVPTEAPIL